jgi:hypothetical protein
MAFVASGVFCVPAKSATQSGHSAGLVEAFQRDRRTALAFSFGLLWQLGPEHMALNTSQFIGIEHD